MTPAARHVLLGAPFDPYRLGNNAAAYSLAGAASDSTYLIDGSNRLYYVADRSGNSAVNGLVLPGVASNTATTATKSLTGNQTITVDWAAADYTPSADHTIFDKLSGNDGIAALMLTTGVLRLRIGDGASVTNVDSTVSVATSNFARATFALIWEDGVGATFTVNGAALGTAVAAVKTLTNAATTATIGTSVVGVIYRVQVGSSYDFNPTLAAKLATSVTDGVSGTWTVGQTAIALPSRIHGARDLYQGLTASMPTYLAYSGTKFGYLNGVSGNSISTPDSAAASVTGDIDLRADVALLDWASVSNFALVTKYGAAGQRSYGLLYENKKLAIYWSANGTTALSALSTVDVPLAALQRSWVRATLDVDNGAAGRTAAFYYSSDGVSWTQLGASVTTATATSIFDSTAAVQVGSSEGALSNVPTGSIYRAQILNGIGGTVVADFNPALFTSGTTFTASTGEVWTRNAGAYIGNGGEAYFDGTADYMKSAPYSLSQPESVYFVGSQVTWTDTDILFDGNASDSRLLYQKGTTPKLATYAGTVAAIDNSALALGTRGVIGGVFNGASSSLRVNTGTATTGSIGTVAPSGFTLGARAGGTQWANITWSEALIRSVADNEALQQRIAAFEMRKWGIS